MGLFPVPIQDFLDAVELFGLSRAARMALTRSKNVLIGKGLEVYPSRNEMAHYRGGFGIELDGCVTAWCAFETGNHYNGLSHERQRKIKRMILLNPESELTRLFSESLEGKGHSTVVEAIRLATSTALKLNEEQVDIRWSDRPLLNLVIADYGTRKSWARIQVDIPFHRPTHWPNIVAHSRRQSLLYRVICDAFEAMWKDAKRPPGPSPDTARLRP